ncbi:MAG: DUF5683 domain-containing protein [Bacteroidota bacterium]
MFSVKKSLLFIVCLFLKTQLFAQVDSLSKPSEENKEIKQNATLERSDNTEFNDIDLQDENVLKLNSPTKVALLAATLPGFGQIYNKKYWKVPLAYGGFVVFASLIDFNHVRYTLFKNALALAEDGDDSTNTDDERLVNRTSDQLRRGRDSFRRDRDFNVILTFLWYGLTIADSVVDSHLRRFNVNEDLSAGIKPSIIDGGFNQPVAGIKFTLYLHTSK